MINPGLAGTQLIYLNPAGNELLGRIVFILTLFLGGLVVASYIITRILRSYIRRNMV